MSKKISLVIPIFNEEDSISEFLIQVNDTLKKELKDYSYELIFINDGSTDNSLNILKKLKIKSKNIKIISFRRNLGKATALDEGFKRSVGDLIVTLDADLQDDPKNIPALIDKLNEGFDLVIGWKKERYDSLSKKTASWIFNYFVRKISKLPFHDFNSGLKIMRKEVIKEIHLYAGLHRFIPILAAQRGFKVGEISIIHHPRKYGTSKYGPERLIRGFLDFLTVSFLATYGRKPLHFFGLIGMAGIVSGVIFGIYLSILHFMGESIGRRPLLIFSVLLIITGFQLLSMGFIADLIIRKNLKINEEIPIDYESE